MHEAIDQKEANKSLYIAGTVIVLFIIALFTNGFGLFDKEKPQPKGDIKLEIGDAPVLGSATAPVTIYEFSDFSCPACAMAAGTTLAGAGYEAPLPNLKQSYINQGEVKLVFKYFPGHGTGGAAHLVGWCLKEQDLFWEFHDKAFAQQADTGKIEAMKTLAEELNADIAALNACLDSKKYNYLLQKDRAMGESQGVRATPTFIVNGQIIEGAVSFEQLEKIIENKLK